MKRSGALSFGGDWTREKLERLRSYLNAYTTALKNQPFELVYIDAFAGTGYCAPEDTEEGQLLAIPELTDTDPQGYLKGSARVALEADPPFDRYVFIDRDPKNCAQLGSLREEFQSKAAKIDVISSDANRCLQDIARQGWRSRRAVLFLDPYGMQVEWGTLEAIAGTRAVDLWYLFPIAAVNRLLTRSASIPQAWRRRLDLVFGDSGWEEAFYRKSRSAGLFGEEELTEKTATFDAIRDYTLDRLRAIFYQVSDRARILRSSTNAPLFLLCFAASNEKGAPIALRIANHILSRK